MAKVDVIMPKLGLTMQTGEVTDLNVEVGDTVEKGDAILEVETEKIATPVESPADGVVVEILAEVGEEYPVGAVLAVLETSD